MPPRKKVRGKQRKTEKDRKGSAAQQMIRELKREGFRVEFKDDGLTVFFHPCMKRGIDKRKLGPDRGFLDDEVSFLC